MSAILYLQYTLPLTMEARARRRSITGHGRNADSGSARSAYLSPPTCDCLSMCRLTRGRRFVRLRGHRIYCSISKYRVEPSKSIPATGTPRSHVQSVERGHNSFERIYHNFKPDIVVASSMVKPRRPCRSLLYVARVVTGIVELERQIYVACTRFGGRNSHFHRSTNRTHGSGDDCLRQE